MTLVKITRWEHKNIEAAEDARWYGTLDESQSWPGFLSFDDFESWPDGYDTYHAPLPNGTSWEEISYEELPESLQSLAGLKDHIDWMLEEEVEV